MKDPKKRLGSLDFRTHNFFKSLDWSKVREKHEKPLFKPSVHTWLDANITGNFDVSAKVAVIQVRD